jgi:hypothetical protein
MPRLVTLPILLVAALTLRIDAAQPPQTNDPPDVRPRWDVDRVAEWAHAHAPTAQLLEIERRAVAQLMDREDAQQRAITALIQAVSAELASHQREQAAADARLSYYRLVAARQQLALLDASEPLLEQLESLAETATQLGVPDGDRDRLADQRLQLEDQWFEVDLGSQRLQLQLGGQVGRLSTALEQITLTSPLPDGTAWQQDEAALVELAFANRHDLRAIETLCRCLNCDSLPAARDLLGSLVPGLGLDVLLETADRGLLGLHARRDSASADLAQRRQQCQSMAESRRQQIRAELRDALLRLESARSRLEVAKRRVTAQREVAERAGVTEQIGDAPAGTQLRARLQSLEYESQRLQRELDLAEAVVALRRAVGQSR